MRRKEPIKSTIVISVSIDGEEVYRDENLQELRGKRFVNVGYSGWGPKGAQPDAVWKRIQKALRESAGSLIFPKSRPLAKGVTEADVDALAEGGYGVWIDEKGHPQRTEFCAPEGILEC